MAHDPPHVGGVGRSTIGRATPLIAVFGSPLLTMLAVVGLIVFPGARSRVVGFDAMFMKDPQADFVAMFRGS